MSELTRIQSEEDFQAALERFRSRGAAQADTPAPAAPPSTRSASEVRIDWYIPKRHRGDTFATYDPQNDSQRDALAAAMEWVEEVAAGEGATLALTGGVGTGKCLAKGTPVLMHDGRILPVEQVRVGEAVMGPDSQPRRVLNTTSGAAPLYQVTPTKGDPYVVNGDHVLSLVMSGRGSGFKPGDVVNIPVREFLAMPKHFKAEAKGYRVGVEFPECSLEMDPYMLGLWLGDGDSDRPVITNPEPEVEEYIHAYADAHSLTVSERNNGGAANAYRIGSSGTVADPNPATTALRSYGLLGNKHVPHEYLANSRANRLVLLAGLIDTDGSLSCGGYEITVKQKELADGILYLCRSLGFAAYSRVKMACATNTPQRTMRPYHRIFISGDLSEVPVRVERKRAPARLQPKNVLRTGVRVEPVGIGDYYGFAVDGDHLFLLGDFTVTHNSHLMYAAIRALNERGVNAGAWGWFDLALLLRDAKFARDEVEHAKAKYERDRLFGVRAFGIDEIRPTSGTDFDATELSQLMTRAYRECQGVIVTSNYADRRLAEIIGMAATSRLTQVQIIGSDYRQTRHLRSVV